MEEQRTHRVKCALKIHFRAEGVMVEEWYLPSISSDTVAGGLSEPQEKILNSRRLRWVSRKKSGAGLEVQTTEQFQ